MIPIAEIYEFLNGLAPVETAEEWDNVGLLAGNFAGTVDKCMVTLDITDRVIDEAFSAGCGLIISHHPLILKPLSRILSEGEGRKAYELIKKNISAICMHTNLDTAEGGVNDVLAAVLGLESVQKLEGNGILRSGLCQDMPFEEFLNLVKRKLDCAGLKYAGSSKVKRVAVGGGSCGDMWRDALEAGCDTFVTGEIKYHHFLEAYEAGLNIVEAGHFATERPVVFALSERLSQRFPALETLVSQEDTDIIRFFS